GPATRHALWLVVLVKLVTPPLLSWPWPVFTRPPPAHPPRAPAVEVQGVDLDRECTEPAAVETPRATVGGGDRLGEGPPTRPRWVRPNAPALGRGAFVAWLAVSSTLAAGQVLRIVRFRRWLRGAVPAPAWLVGEAERVGERLGVGVPEALAVPGLGVPL